ncbi:MAG: hypothetical protein IH840_01420 [Candidatus Heimdallarchaeota archaeon]|nr:hypothetical protein [Candidatus Heimdallarchaeota archaeon]
MSDQAIGILINRTGTSVKWKRQRLGLFKENRKRITKYQINLNFFKEWNDPMAYALGFIYSDGTIRINKAKFHYSFKIAIKDLTLLQKINSAMASNIPIKPRIIPTGILYELSIGRKSMVYDLVSLGLIPNKSRIMKFPKIPENFLLPFIRGYFDGDGSVLFLSNRLKVKITSGSEAFIREMQVKFSELNLQTSMRIVSAKNRKNPWYEINILGNSRKEFFDLIYRDASIYLERKYQVFQSYFARPILKTDCLGCGKSIIKKNTQHVRCRPCSRAYGIIRDRKRASIRTGM